MSLHSLLLTEMSQTRSCTSILTRLLRPQRSRHRSGTRTQHRRVTLQVQRRMSHSGLHKHLPFGSPSVKVPQRLSKTLHSYQNPSAYPQRPKRASASVLPAAFVYSRPLSSAGFYLQDAAEGSLRHLGRSHIHRALPWVSTYPIKSSVDRRRFRPMACPTTWCQLKLHRRTLNRQVQH